MANVLSHRPSIFILYLSSFNMLIPLAWLCIVRIYIWVNTALSNSNIMYICMQITKHDLSLVLCYVHMSNLSCTEHEGYSKKWNIFHVHPISTVLFILSCKATTWMEHHCCWIKLYLLSLCKTSLPLLSLNILGRSLEALDMSKHVYMLSFSSAWGNNVWCVCLTTTFI